MTSEKYCLALDVGGTNVAAGLVSTSGQVLSKRYFPTQATRPVEVVIGDMITNLQELITQSPTPPVALAVGLPGWIDTAKGVLVRAPNMPDWNHVPMADIMQRALGLPVLLENDANLYALGEWLYGSGQGLKNLIVMTLGTGVGSGLILNGKLWYGSFTSAAEAGHIPLTLDGAECGCGGRGCLETIASATAMGRLGREWLERGGLSNYKGRPEDLTTEIMYELAKGQDAMALSVFKQAGQALGRVLAGMFNLLGLEGAVVGGGAAGAFEFIEPGLQEIISQRVIITNPENIKIAVGSLGQDAPLLGASALVNQILLQELN